MLVAYGGCSQTIFGWYTPIHSANKDKQAASFCCQVATWALDIFCSFYNVNNPKSACNLTTHEAREKTSSDLES